MAPKIEKDAIHGFSAELAQELGAEIDEKFSEHHWAFALILEPGIRLFAAIENGKATYSLIAFASEGRVSRPAIECGVAVNRGAAVNAKEIRKRLLPEATPLALEALESFKEQDAARARVAKKAESLSKRYPELKIKVRTNEPDRIDVATKYGTGVQLDAYIYEESHYGNWRLTSDRGRAFSMDNIDSKYGRAFLKLCNEN